MSAARGRPTAPFLSGFRLTGVRGQPAERRVAPPDRGTGRSAGRHSLSGYADQPPSNTRIGAWPGRLGRPVPGGGSTLWAMGALKSEEWQAARTGLDQAEADLRAELDDKAAPPARVDIEQARSSWPH